MPTYEYKCPACEKQFEAFHSISAKPLKICTLCGAKGVQRMISAGAGLLFKGSGFYITDYRSDSYKNSAKSDSPTASSSSGDGGGSSGSSTSSNDSSSKPAAPKSDSAGT